MKYDNQFEDIKDSAGKQILSKYEYDLYHEEDNKINPIIRVKRFSVSNKNERWKIFENTKVLLVLEGVKFNKKEKEFLRSPEGFNFILTTYKSGFISLNAFKKQLKEKLKK